MIVIDAGRPGSVVVRDPIQPPYGVFGCVT